MKNKNNKNTLLYILRSLIIPNKRDSTPTPTMTPKKREVLLTTFLTEITQLVCWLNSSMEEASNQSNDKLNRQFLSHYYNCTILTFDWCHDFCCFLYRITTVLLSTSNLIMIIDFFSAASQKRLWDFHFICEYIVKIPNSEVLQK